MFRPTVRTLPLPFSQLKIFLDVSALVTPLRGRKEASHFLQSSPNLFGLVFQLIDRMTKIGDRHFSGAFRYLSNKGEFSLDPCPELYFDLVPGDLLPGGFTTLVLIQGPVPGEAGDARGAIEIRFLFRFRI